MATRLRFRADERGVSAVEFAFIAPVMALMLMGLMEFGYVSFARTSLEHATLRAARSAVASTCQSTRESDMLEEIEHGMRSIIAYDDEPADIQYRSYSNNFGDVGNPEPFNDVNGDGEFTTGESYTDVNGNGSWDNDMGRDESVGDAGQVVSYRSSYKVKSLFPAISASFNDDQPYYQISANTVVRNEPVFQDDCT